MSAATPLLNSLKTALAAAAPARVVTRTLKHYTQRDQATELMPGIYTVISRGLNRERGKDYLDVLLVGQLQVAEGADGETLEEAEFAMIDEISNFVERVQGARVDVSDIRQSAQVDAPYGWVAARLRVGPFLLRAYSDMDELSDFLTYHAEHSLAPGDDEPAAIDHVNLPQG